jgi:capsid protein
VKGWNKVRFVTPRRITVDAGREAQQNRADVETGLKTLEEHFAELGQDFDEQLEIRAQNAKAILEAAERHGVPVEMLYRTSGGSPVDRQAEEKTRG